MAQIETFPLHTVLLTVALLTLTSLPLTSAVCAHAPGYIYIIGEYAEGSEYYKVGGSTRNGDARRREIQIGNPRELYVDNEFWVHDCYDAEEEAHETARH